MLITFDGYPKIHTKYSRNHLCRENWSTKFGICWVRYWLALMLEMYARILSDFGNRALRKFQVDFRPAIECCAFHQAANTTGFSAGQNKCLTATLPPLLLRTCQTNPAASLCRC